MRVIAIALTAATMGALLWVTLGAFTSPGGASDDGMPKFVSASADAGWGEAPVAAIQDQGGDANQDDVGGAARENNDRVGVQVWTITAAGAAMGAGLVLFLLRIIMGWVKPAPDAERVQH